MHRAQGAPATSPASSAVLLRTAPDAGGMAPATASAIGGLRQGGIDRHRLAMLPEDEPNAPGGIKILEPH